MFISKNPIKNSYQDGLGRTTQTLDHVVVVHILIWDKRKSQINEFSGTWLGGVIFTWFLLTNCWFCSVIRIWNLQVPNWSLRSILVSGRVRFKLLEYYHFTTQGAELNTFHSQLIFLLRLILSCTHSCPANGCGHSIRHFVSSLCVARY